MNKVYLSGTLIEGPVAINREDTPLHVVFKLLVSHRAKAGIKREIYRISSWNQCAEYCMNHLKKDMRVGIMGYLTQRPMLIGETKFLAVEVTAREIIGTNI